MIFFKTKKIFALMFTVFIVILTIFSNDVQKVVASSKHRIIRVGYFQWTDTFTLAAINKLFSKNFKTTKNVTFEVELVPQPSGVYATANLLAKELHLTFLGNTVYPWAVSRGAKIKTIHSMVTVGSGNEGCVTTTTPATDGKFIKSPADLKGKIIAVPCTSTAHFQLYQLANMFDIPTANFNAGEGITVVCLKPSEMQEQLKSKKIDGACTWQPTLSDLQNTVSNTKQIWDFSDLTKWG